MKGMRPVQAILAALGILLISYIFALASVHSYCENRKYVAVLGVLSIAMLVGCFRSRGESMPAKVALNFGKIFCVLALAINAAFIAIATHDCRHMFDQLNIGK
jgi:hypothetical protein